MKTQERQAYIQCGILVALSGLIDEETGVTYGFIVGISADAGTDPFYFKQVIDFKDMSNVFRNDLICIAQTAASCQLVLRFLGVAAFDETVELVCRSDTKTFLS